MKYIFIAHSHTLCLSDIGIIDLLALETNDVIFLKTRAFSCEYFPKGSNVYDAKEFYEECKAIYFESNHARRRKAISKLDKIIKQWTNDIYELFLPHLCDPYAMILATNKQCKKVSFVQEGAFTVEKRFETKLSFTEKIKRKINTVRVYHTLRFYGMNWYVDGQINQKEIDTYSLYPEYFKYLPSNVHIIKWPRIDCDIEIDDKGVYFIMDGFVKNGMAESDIYLSQCKKMILRFYGKENYIKFHPNQTKEECDMILSFFSEIDAKYQVLEQAIPFEFYITNGKKLTIIGMSSSLLFFAKNQGHNVISCDSWMMESLKFKKLHDDGMPLFHEYFSDVQPVINYK